MIKRVLIADDSATARTIIKRCLEIAGCAEAEFTEATDGREALRMVKETDVDLLVTDLNMPNMDGRSLLRSVKASPKLTSLPIIVISSASNGAVEHELRELGAHAVVSKPVSPASVAHALEALTDENNWG